MHIKDNLINFLYDKNYYMCLYDDSLYCFNYQELLSLSANRIVLKVPKRDIEIKGSNLSWNDIGVSLIIALKINTHSSLVTIYTFSYQI